MAVGFDGRSAEIDAKQRQNATNTRSKGGGERLDDRIPDTLRSAR